jgi:hypothetical protein
MKKKQFIPYLLLICCMTIVREQSLAAAQAQVMPNSDQQEQPALAVSEDILQKVDDLTTAVNGISQAANDGVKAMPSLARELRKTRKAFVLESNSWGKKAKKLIKVMTEQDQEIKGLNNSSKFIIKKATFAVLATLFIAAALVFLYHDHAKAALMTTPVPTLRFFDRFKNRLLSKSTGFFCLGALAYRQLCV